MAKGSLIGDAQPVLPSLGLGWLLDAMPMRTRLPELRLRQASAPSAVWLPGLSPEAGPQQSLPGRPCPLGVPASALLSLLVRLHPQLAWWVPSTVFALWDGAGEKHPARVASAQWGGEAQ